jgi:hypothetical protein
VDGRRKQIGQVEALQTHKALQEGLDANKQLTVFRPPKREAKTEAGRTDDHTGVPDVSAKEQSPMLGQIYQESLTKYKNPPSGPMSMASGSPAFLAKPLTSKAAARPLLPQQQKEDEPASKDRSSRIGNVNS